MKEMSENMKKISKILGAAAIVVLFLVSAVASTSLAATQAPQFETSEEETQFETSDPVDPDEEPQGIIPADLVPVKVGKQMGTGKLYVTIANKGLGIAWLPYFTHMKVNGIANGQQNLLCLFGPRFPGQAKTYTSRIQLAGTIPRYTLVIVDYTNIIFEGIFGEGNNKWTGYV
jgi:hypothetical protein